MDQEDHFIIAISRQIGAGGAFLGQRVAASLIMAYLDRDLISQTAIALEVSPTEPPLRQPRPGTWWEDFCETFRRAAPPDGCYRSPPIPSPDRPFHETEAHVIRELVRLRDTVIVGRGATMVLQGHPRLFRVFLHAPRDFRIARVAEAYGLTDPRDAETLITEVDAERHRFYRNTFGVDWTDASHYDLTLDTAALGFSFAERIIAEEAERRRWHGITH